MTTVITTTAQKSGTVPASFVVSLSVAPKVAIGIYRWITTPGDYLDLTIIAQSITATNLAINYTVGVNTTIQTLGIFYLAVSQSISLLMPNQNVPFTSLADSNYMG